MLRAIQHVKTSAYNLRALYPHFPYQYRLFDVEEMACVQEWADSASACLLEALDEQLVPLDAPKIAYYLDKCMGVQKIVYKMPPTVDTIDALERLREAVQRLKDALRTLLLHQKQQKQQKQQNAEEEPCCCYSFRENQILTSSNHNFIE